MPIAHWTKHSPNPKPGQVKLQRPKGKYTEDGAQQTSGCVLNVRSWKEHSKWLWGGEWDGVAVEGRGRDLAILNEHNMIYIVAPIATAYCQCRLPLTIASANCNCQMRLPTATDMTGIDTLPPATA